MRRIALAAALCASTACSQMAGVGANAGLRAHQGASASEQEKAIAQRLAAEPGLDKLKASVAVANHWRDGFATRSSVLLAGTAPDAEARERAIRLIRDIIGGDPEAIAVVDLSRIEPR